MFSERRAAKERFSRADGMLVCKGKRAIRAHAPVRRRHAWRFEGTGSTAWASSAIVHGLERCAASESLRAGALHQNESAVWMYGGLPLPWMGVGSEVVASTTPTPAPTATTPPTTAQNQGRV